MGHSGKGRPRHTHCYDGECGKCGIEIKKKVARRQENMCITCAIWGGKKK